MGVRVDEVGERGAAWWENKGGGIGREGTGNEGTRSVVQGGEGGQADTRECSITAKGSYDMVGTKSRDATIQTPAQELQALCNAKTPRPERATAAVPAAPRSLCGVPDLRSSCVCGPCWHGPRRRWDPCSCAQTVESSRISMSVAASPFHPHANTAGRQPSIPP